MSAQTLRMGTRGSPLAKAQSSWYARLLEKANPGLSVESVLIKTSGDTLSERINEGRYEAPAAASEALGEAAPNVKAMFVKEIEAALFDKRVDFAVHSAKDLPADIPEGLVLAGYPVREDPRDVFIGAPGRASLAQLPQGAKVGTASLRRQIQLRASRPDLSFVALRGNVDTRLRKLAEGQASGIVLALAGLRRLGLAGTRHEVIGIDAVIPAPGQGALALECRADAAAVLAMLAPTLDEKTRLEVDIERRFLKAVGGGCATPLGALARVEAGEVSMVVFWSDVEGKKPVRLSGRAGRRPEEISSLVDGLAGRLRAGA
ncbi:MAG: hydroxymethylbilane synthase [Elusimicrobia bacterium]|nr:hydroxymethylbilane synthase [Elusimicrobiota bacterium]